MAYFIKASETMYDAYVGKAKANTNPDQYDWDWAMASPYVAEFLQAAQIKLKALGVHETWFEDLKSNAINKIINSQWVFTIKRTASGKIKKFKARIVLRGDQMDNIDQTTGKERDNASPVAAWPTIRLFLVTSIRNKWITTTIDFSNAFVQSILPEDDPVWMHIPRGYKSTKGPDYCLKLKKSLYGHKRAPLLWFEHLAEVFGKLGLKQSKFDPCLLDGKDIMVVQYVDDCGIAAPNQARIDKFISDLKDIGLQLTQKESFSEFLGIHKSIQAP